MALTVIVLIASVLIWAWLASGIVALLFQLSRAGAQLTFAAVATAAILLLMVSYKPGERKPGERQTPAPCVPVVDDPCYPRPNQLQQE